MSNGVGEPWIAELRSSDVTLRRRAARQLATLERVPPAAAVVLVDASEDTDDEVRNWSTDALERLEHPDLQSLAELKQRLGNAGADGAYWAATLIGRLAKDGTPVVASLVDALRQHAVLAVREKAAWAIGQVGSGARAALPDLQRAAEEDLPRLANLAQAAIQKIEGDEGCGRSPSRGCGRSPDRAT